VPPFLEFFLKFPSFLADNYTKRKKVKGDDYYFKFKTGGVKWGI